MLHERPMLPNPKKGKREKKKKKMEKRERRDFVYNHIMLTELTSA